MSKTINTITATHARENFSLIVNRTVFSHEKYIVERNGRKLAVLLSFDEYQLTQELINRCFAEYRKNEKVCDR